MKRILLIADEQPSTQALRNLIGMAHPDYEVSIEPDGIVALRKIIGGEFNVIVLDLVTEAMDGFQLLDELVRRGAQANVFVMSVLPSEHDRARALDLGVLGYFVKDEEGLKMLVQSIESL